MPMQSEGDPELTLPLRLPFPLIGVINDAELLHHYRRRAC